MVQFEYNGVMKRHDVKVPFSLAGESDMVMVASITEENKIKLHRDLSIKLLRQILLSWDEKEHMDTERANREEREHDELLTDKKKYCNGCGEELPVCYCDDPEKFSRYWPSRKQKIQDKKIQDKKKGK